MRTERWDEDRFDAHVLLIIREMDGRQVHLDPNAIRKLLRGLWGGWVIFHINWDTKFANMDQERPRIGSSLEHQRQNWPQDHFGSGEHNAIMEDGKLSSTPLHAFLPIIKEFVDDPVNGFPAQRNEKNGRSFRFGSLENTDSRNLPPHQWFAILVGRFFSEHYGPQHWRSANAYIQKHWK